MAQRCEICGRGALKGNRRSHSNIASIVRRKLNLQRRVVDGQRKRVCTSCLKNQLAPARARVSAA